MRYLIPITLLFILACTSQTINKYTISGKIIGKTPAMAYLQIYNNSELQTIDSAEFINGEFEFTGNVEIPEKYYIKIGEQRPFSIFIENSPIQILGNIDSLNVVKITGSEIQNKLDSFQKLTDVFNAEMELVYKQYQETQDTEEKNILENKLDSIYDSMLDFTKNYVKENGNSILSAYLIRTNLIHSLELDELEELTNAVNPEFKESKYTKYLFDRIATLRQLQPGETAPLFSQINTNDDTVNLNDFKGKYLLIDFWASWCGPCRRANPTVVEMYRKYNKKGFEILGVSMDNNKDKWLDAIETDGLTWVQVSTLEGWKNPVGKLYGVNSIPHAILIDAEGKIVKRGIHANELDELLGNLLQ